MNERGNSTNEEIRHIMIVDDEDDHHLITRMMLKRSGFGGRLSTFQDPLEALLHLRTCADRPDLLLVDINMPATDGFEFLRHCQEEDLIRPEATTVVMCSSSNRPMDMQLAEQQAVVHEYIEKPLTPDHFLRIAGDHRVRHQDPPSA
jgi:CheY-like chemotaxis protein